MIVKRVLISVAAAILLEVLVFNFQTCCQSIRGAPQLTLETAQLTLQNWDKSETGEYTSLPDPMIYVEGLSMQVETIRIKTDMEPLPNTPCSIRPRRARAFPEKRCYFLNR